MTQFAPLFTPESSSSAGFSGRDLLRLLFKHRWVVLSCLILVSAIAIYGAMCQPREYIASAQIRIRTEQQGTPSFLSGVAAYRETTIQDTPSRRIETEMAELMNRSSVESVIQHLSLRPQDLKRSPIDVALDPLIPALNLIATRAMRLFGYDTQGNAQADPLAESVKAFERSVAIEAVRSKGAEVTSNVIEIKLTGTDRERTRAALASLLDEYVERSSARDLQLGKQALEALKIQATEAQVKMVKAEDAIMAYSLHPRSSGDGSTSVAVGRGVPLAEAKMRSDEGALQARLDVLLETFGDEYAEVKATRSALEKLRARTQSQARDTVRSDATLGVLERRRAVAETRYVELQRKLDQIDLYLKLSPTEVEGRLVTEPPRQAAKVSIATKLIGIVAGPIVGLLLGLVLAGVFEVADRRLQTRESVQNYLGFETLALLPQMAPERRPDAPLTILPPLAPTPASIEVKHVVKDPTAS